MDKDDKLVSCPFEWVVTPSVALKAIETICAIEADELNGWKETMLLCGYICLHWTHYSKGQ